MDWTQVLTLMSTIVTTFAAGGYAIHSLLRGDIKEFKQELKEDMRTLEDRFDRRMEIYESDRRYTNEMIRHMDEKWERLFERLLVQDKART
jgi:hypothetical protein